MRIIINPRYDFYKDFIIRICSPSRFSNNGKVLQTGRNTIKLFEAAGIKLVVKSYEHLTLFNRLVYGALRKSKAERAYLHAIRLQRLGIGTPEEIAFVEIRRYGLLRSCYFVSLYSDYQSLSSATIDCMPNGEKYALLDALAKFLFKIHWAGVLHKDLNIGNILYTDKCDTIEGFYFQVVDTNRMVFHSSLSTHQRIQNLRRLSCSIPSFLYILKRYATIAGIDPESMQLNGVFARLIFGYRQSRKRTIKAILHS